MTNESDRLYVGVDAGGTSIDVRFCCGDREGEFQMSGVNIRRDGAGRAVQSFVELVSEARKLAGCTPASPAWVVIGAAGAGDQSTREKVQTAIQARSDGLAYVTLMSDAALALNAAHGGNPGAVIIVGTGSVAILRRVDGKIITRGGLGYILGDDASGYAIGRAAARLLARSLDEESGGMLAAELSSTLEVDSRESLFNRVYDEAYPLQRLARIVIEAASRGDKDARQIIDEQMDALARTVSILDREWDDDVAINYCVIGGLASYPLVRNELARRVPDRWHLVEPGFDDPVDAALAIALQSAAD